MRAMRRYDIVTFDCYGTLIDWERGIADAFRDAGLELDRDVVLRAYAEQEPIAEQPPFRPYREVLADGNDVGRPGDARPGPERPATRQIAAGRGEHVDHVPVRLVAGPPIDSKAGRAAEPAEDGTDRVMEHVCGRSAGRASAGAGRTATSYPAG